MIKFEKTTTIQKNQKTITNNIEQATITIKTDKAEIIKPFCILQITKDTVTIKKTGTITTTTKQDPTIKDILPLLEKPKPKNTKKQTKKEATTKKNTKKS